MSFLIQNAKISRCNLDLDRVSLHPTTGVALLGTLAPTNPFLLRPVRPRPSQFSFSVLVRSSIFSCASSPLCMLTNTLMHCNIRPTVSVTWLLSGGPPPAVPTELPCPPVPGRGGMVGLNVGSSGALVLLVARLRDESRTAARSATRSA